MSSTTTDVAFQWTWQQMADVAASVLAPVAVFEPPTVALYPLHELFRDRPFLLLASAVLASAALLFATTFLPRLLRRILYPRSFADPSRSEPLPPGSLGCPFFGHTYQVVSGSSRHGPGHFLRSTWIRLGRPRLFKVSMFGRPRCVLSGGKLVREMLRKEFQEGALTNGAPLNSQTEMLGPESLFFESDRSRHRLLRRLVGAALTPRAVSAAVPNLRRAAEEQIAEMLRAEMPVKMEDVCTAFTLDVAWRQIIGLKLGPDEVPDFLGAVGQWITGITTLRSVFKIRVETNPTYIAKAYLVKKIEEKIDELERNGPDHTSTLSGMLFATDDDEGGEEEDADNDGGVASRRGSATSLSSATSRRDSMVSRRRSSGMSHSSATSRKLTRKQVIDNALFLILAGSETSASTLTNAILLLGMHRQAWTKLVEEQLAMQAKHGDVVSKELLDRECPYLEAVIKETMRIRPFAAGPPRLTRGTITLDGKQIPEGWGVTYNVQLTHEQDPICYRPDGSHMCVRRGFRPERWLDAKTRPSSDFIPMIAGPRFCLGSHLAYTEMKVFLAVLARTVEFDLAEDYLEKDLEWKRMSIIPKPADGVPVFAKAKVV